MLRLPDPPPQIRLKVWPYPLVDAVAGVVEIEAYSADIMAGTKRVRHLRPPMVRDYEGARYVIVLDDEAVIAVYRVVPRRPLDPDRLLEWPFDEDDVSLT